MHVLESRKGEAVHQLEQLAFEVRHNKDLEYMKRAKAFLKRSTNAGKRFFLYFPLHDALPNVLRAEFKGKTGHDDWADSLLELDTDFGTLLDHLKQLSVENNTIVVFSGDNGPEEHSSLGAARLATSRARTSLALRVRHDLLEVTQAERISKITTNATK